MTDIRFRLSQTCLEDSYLQSLYFWNGAITAVKEIIWGVTNEEDNESNFECPNAGQLGFQKLVYQDYESEEVWYTNFFNEGVIKDQIVMEFNLGMASNKIVSQRESFGMLDLFGDIGGFQDFMHLFLEMFGAFFAQKFFL